MKNLLFQYIETRDFFFLGNYNNIKSTDNVRDTQVIK